VDLVSVSDAQSDCLDAGMRYAQLQGVSASATRLAGQPARAILEHARRVGAWLLVVGRIGADSDDSMDIGSITERLVRGAPCDVFLSSRTASVAAIDQQASVS
jgi:nucleotide-binding universal stress UspA family protein